MSYEVQSYQDPRLVPCAAQDADEWVRVESYLTCANWEACHDAYVRANGHTDKLIDAPWDAFGCSDDCAEWRSDKGWRGRR